MALAKKSGKNFPKKGEVYWVSLDPTQGNEIQKTRPGLIISNDMGNEHTNVVIIAPITSNSSRVYQVEARAIIDGKKAKIMPQQCRAVDKSRLGEKIEMVEKEVMLDVERALKTVFDLS